jgi:hypothetical protein
MAAIQLVGNKLVGLYETADPFTLKPLDPGVYTYLLTTGGNSLLSSLFVGNCPSGASITVRYYSQTTGDQLDERTDLTSHNTIATSQTSADQIIVTRIHNKTYVEVEIVGGTVTFGLEVTVISTFAVDLSAATKKDNAAFFPLVDQALPIAVLDRTLNQYRMWNGEVTLSGGTINAVVNPIKTPVVQNIPLPDNTTEVMVVIPIGTTKYEVRSTMPFRMSHVSSGPYLTLSYDEVAGLDATVPVTLYVKSVSAAGSVLQLRRWQ